MSLLRFPANALAALLERYLHEGPAAPAAERAGDIVAELREHAVAGRSGRSAASERPADDEAAAMLMRTANRRRRRAIRRAALSDRARCVSVVRLLGELSCGYGAVRRAAIGPRSVSDGPSVITVRSSNCRWDDTRLHLVL